MRVLMLAFLCLTGCSCRAPDDCDQVREVDRVIRAYEARYAHEPLTDDQRGCATSFQVHQVGIAEFRDMCGPNFLSLTGCTYAATGDIYMRRAFMTREYQMDTLRHELVHLLLYCVGRPDPVDHSIPEFNWTGSVSADHGVAPDAERLPYEVVCTDVAVPGWH
jgi:hypothetical protein